jgi:hypothetical protein
MAKPMFFYAALYDNVHDADADYEAIRHCTRATRSAPTTPRSLRSRPTAR